MELYDQVSYKVSRLITLDYSTSFGSSTKLFPKSMQPHIYAIYGLVRIADEVVDTYKGEDAAQLLEQLESEVYAALKRGYSVNPIVHSFVLSARDFGIDARLIRPFFESMAMDIKPVVFTQKLYAKYIYGSAEVVGLMCLRVFVAGDDLLYKDLQVGAKALGGAYQKVNFLRDMAADYKELGRVYFPGVSYDCFDEITKLKIVSDIENDLDTARESLARLPNGSREAVELSAAYYGSLLSKLKQTPAEIIKQKRIRVGGFKKAVYLWRVIVKGVLNNVA